MSVFTLTKEHLDVLEDKKLKSNPKLIEKTIRNDDFYTLDQQEMKYFLLVADALYRSGKPIVSDKDFDEKEKWYKVNHPESKFPDKLDSGVKEGGKTVKLPQKMLSTDKAYSRKEIEKWLDRIFKAALNLNISRDE
ncbi:DNA ligase, partial [Vibrio parahaemolyticus]|nr:DNA ligase [Vibrio parahaemolyticus]